MNFIIKKITFLICCILMINVSFAQKHKKLGLVFDKTVFSFNEIEQWNNQAAIFTFTNKSKHPVSILPLFSENQLDVITPNMLINPGESAQIKAIFYTDGIGPFSKKFPIYFGSVAAPVYLKITGNIRSLSPEAYIQCPMAKPELAKTKIELTGDVAEIISEIPLRNVSISLINLQNTKEIELSSNNKGRFASTVPVGNFIVQVRHPEYEMYSSNIYVGQTSAPLKIRLIPIDEKNIFAENTSKSKSKKELLTSIEKKEEFLTSENTEREEPKKENPNKTDIIIEVEINTDDNIQTPPKKNEGLDRNIEYVKNEPIDNPFGNKEEENEPIENKTKENQSILEETFDEEVAKIENEIEKPKDETLVKKETKIEKPSKPKKNDTPVFKEEIEKKKPVKKEINNKPEIDYHKYTFRILDKSSYDPIENASLKLTELFKKKRNYKNKSDERGFSEIELPYNDYKLLSTADGYISEEIKISKDDKSKVFEILMSPVSDLFQDIYTKKENEKSDKETLDKFSFGKQEFSFAKDENQKNEPELVALKNNESEETVNDIDRELELEKIQKINERAKRDSIELHNSKIRQNEIQAERDRALEMAKKESEKVLLGKAFNKIEKERIDSLTRYITELQNKNSDLENNISTINQDKIALEKANLRDRLALEKIKNEKLEKENNIVLSPAKYSANNIIFLIDVSTSMGKKNKIELLKKSIKNLSFVLRDIDRVAIISYNQKTNIELESVIGTSTSEINLAIDSLKTGGLTNGVRGIKKAYEMLEYYLTPNGNNQIILATDGLFSKYNNEMNEYELNRLVKRQSEKNMKLTVVGFGNDEEGKPLMEKLARNGNGQYIQIKNDWMTKDVLIKEIKLNSEIKD